MFGRWRTQREKNRRIKNCKENIWKNILESANKEVESVSKVTSEKIKGYRGGEHMEERDMKMQELLDEVERLRKENERLSQIAAIAGEGFAEAVRGGKT